MTRKIENDSKTDQKGYTSKTQLNVDYTWIILDLF
jgi:hypothetical protein